MKFTVYFEIHGVSYYTIVTGGRAVQHLRKCYHVYDVRRYH